MSEYNPFIESNLKLSYDYEFKISELIEMFYTSDLQPKKHSERYEKENNTFKSLYIDIIALDFEPKAYGCNIQRDLVWEHWRKLDLINSIYLGRRIGSIILAQNEGREILRDIRSHSGYYAPLAYATPEKPFIDYEYLLIDGKQRLTTILSFIRNEFADHNGKYFKDLSENAKGRFMRFDKLELVKMQFTNDNDIIDLYVLTSFAAKQQEKEHIDYILSLKR